MGDLHESGMRPAASTAPLGAADRRRPGRPQSVSPTLLPLLRAPHGAADVPISAAPTGLDDVVTADMASASGGRGDDDLRPARGMFGSVLIIAPFWAVVLYFVLR